MDFAAPAEQSLRDGDPVTALALLQEVVRVHPADTKLRVFLFQLLCVLGQWERALNQLGVATGLDPAALAMAQTYGDAIRCEIVRAQVFDGKKSPVVFGVPEQWLALLIESLLVAGRGQPDESENLRGQAFEEAQAVSGDIDGQPFNWIADADSRLGPVLEAMINGRYYWVPFARLTKIVIEPPEDLRDMVWMPAHLQFENGGESVALIPTRYPGSETSEEGLIALARKTTWEQIGADAYRGFGQRIITTDLGELPLMEIRSINLEGELQPDSSDARA